MNENLKIEFGNLYSNLPDSVDEEFFDPIIISESCKIERIISKGHRSPDNAWYDQDKNEWVMVLKGSAELEFENDNKILKMIPGDHVNIPAHCRHRVEWTDPNAETIWLAIHY